VNPTDIEPGSEPEGWYTKLGWETWRLNDVLTCLECVRAPAVVVRGKQEDDVILMRKHFTQFIT
jgi:hypothetical protein